MVAEVGSLCRCAGGGGRRERERRRGGGCPLLQSLSPGNRGHGSEQELSAPGEWRAEAR